MKIDNDWRFKDLIYHLQTLKQEYDSVLASFFWYEIKEKNRYIREIRNKFYSLNLKEWQIDVCWEYMNNYRIYEDILKIIKRIDK